MSGVAMLQAKLEQVRNVAAALRGKGGDKKPKGYKPVRKHKAGTVRARMHEIKMTTLDVGDIYKAICLPQGGDLNEWMAMNTVDVFNELSLIYSVVVDIAEAKYKRPGEGFPQGFEYRWLDPPNVRVPLKCSAPQYTDYVMSWADGQLSDEVLFPTSDDAEFPDDFEDRVRSITKRLFRVFAILYHGHWKVFEELQMEIHLNTCFKRFMFFVFEFDLVSERELNALKALVERLQKEFLASKKKG